MKKSVKMLLLIGGAVTVCGLIVMTVSLACINFDFSKLSTVGKPEKIEKTVDVSTCGEFIFEADTDNIKIGVSPDSEAHLTYYQSEQSAFDMKNENGVLSLSNKNLRQKWYEYIQISFYFHTNDVIVLLPEDFSGKLSIETTTGNVEIAELSELDSVRVSVTTGRITLSGVTCESAVLKSSTGRISAESLTIAQSLSASTTTGRITAENIACADARLETTTGNIDLTRFASDSIRLQATTGNIKGSISGNKSDFTITSSSVTGKNNLSDNQSQGLKSLNVRTTTGSINIDFAG